MKKLKVYSEINNKAILKKFLYKGEYISKGADFAILQTKDGEYKIKAPFSGRVKKPSKLNRKIRKKTALAYIIPDTVPINNKPIKEKIPKSHNKKYNNSLNINFNGWRSLEQNDYLEEIDNKNVPDEKPKIISAENKEMMFDLNASKNLINKLKEESTENETLLEHNKRLMEENQQKLSNKRAKNNSNKKVNETFANLSSKFKERKASVSKDAVSVEEKTHNSIDFLDENGRPKILRNIISNRMNKLIESNLSNDNIAFDNVPKAKTYNSTVYNKPQENELNGNNIFANQNNSSGYSFTGSANPFEEINKEKEFLHQQNTKNDIYRKRYKPINSYQYKKPKEILVNNEIEYLEKSNNPYDKIKLRMLKIQNGEKVDNQDREIPLSQNNKNNPIVDSWLENQYLSHPDNKNNPNIDRKNLNFNLGNQNNIPQPNIRDNFTSDNKVNDSFNQNYINSSYANSKQQNVNNKNIINREIIKEQIPIYIQTPQNNFSNNQNHNPEQLLKQQSNYYELSNEIKNLNLKFDMQSNYQNHNDLIGKLHDLELKIANIDNKPKPNAGAAAIDNNTISINSMNSMNNELIRTLQLLLNKPDSNKELLKDISSLIINNANNANQVPAQQQQATQPYIVQNLINRVNEKHFDPNINTYNEKPKYETKPASSINEIGNMPNIPIDVVKESLEKTPITVNAKINNEDNYNEVNDNQKNNYYEDDSKVNVEENNQDKKEELVINLDEIEKPLEVNETKVQNAASDLNNNNVEDLQSIYKKSNDKINEKIQEILDEINFNSEKNISKISSEPFDRAKVEEKEFDIDENIETEAKEIIEENNDKNDLQSIYQSANKISDNNKSSDINNLDLLLKRIQTDLDEIEKPLKSNNDENNNLNVDLKDMLSKLKEDLESIESAYKIKKEEKIIENSPYIIKTPKISSEPFDCAKVEEKEFGIDENIETEAKEIIEENNDKNDLQSIYQSADKIINGNNIKSITDDNEIDLESLENVTYKQPKVEEKELSINDINFDEAKDKLEENNTDHNLQSIYQSANNKLVKERNLDNDNEIIEPLNEVKTFNPVKETNDVKNLNYKNKIHIQNLNVYNNPNNFVDFFDNDKQFKNNKKVSNKIDTENKNNNELQSKPKITNDEDVMSNSKKQLENILNNQDVTLYDFSETEYDDVKNKLLTIDKKENPFEIEKQNNYVSSKKQLENILNKDYDNLLDLSNDNYLNLKKELLESNTSLKNDFIILQNNKVASTNKIKETKKAINNPELSKVETFIKNQNSLVTNNKPTAKITLKNENKDRSIIQDGKMLLLYDEDAIISEIESIEIEAKKFNNKRLFPTPLIRETNISIDNNDKYNNINYSKIKTKAINFTVDLTMLLKLQYRFKKANKALGIDFSIKSFIVKAISHTLLKNNNLNLIKDLKKDIAIQKFSHNVGLALDIDQGVIIPVIRYVDRLQIRQISSCEQDLEYRLACGELFDYEVYGYSIVLSTFEHAMSGIKFDILSKIGTIVAVDKIEKQLIRINNAENQIRYLLNFAIVFNAKHITKHMASKFANVLKKIIENPSELVN